MRKGLLIAAAAVALAAPVAAQTPDERAGRVEAGLGLAVRYCDVCHGVERSLNPPDLAPPLLGLAQHADGGKAWLRAWLAAPHPPLKATLSPRQVDEIAAYLTALRSRN